jgi:hypothetical protein
MVADLDTEFREQIHLVAPVANNLVLSCISQHVFGVPRSF